MADTGSGVSDYPVIVITFLVGITVLVLVYISSLLKTSKEDDVKNTEGEVPKKEKQKDVPTSNLKTNKKKHSEKWVRDSKQSFSHPWLLTSLKGHSGEVLDMDFSSNGKFLATCAEDSEELDPGGEGSSEQCSGSEGNKENSPQPGGKGVLLSRRQKKNRVRRDDGSPVASQNGCTSSAKKSKARTRRSTNTGDDRAILIWSTKDWNQKDHKSLRINVEFDHGKFVKWSPDCKAFIVQKAAEQVLEVYKVAKKPDGWISAVTKALTFSKHHEDDVVGIGIACNGKYIISCSEKNDLVVCDLKGEVLTKIDTYLVKTMCARISPCARFIVASGFAPDVKVWEVKFSKTGEFQQVARAFELTGHSSGIYDVAFNADSSRMATVSKDGTWRVYNTKIEYEKGEDPHLLSSGKYSHIGRSHIALSPNGEVVTVSSGSSLAFYSVHNGQCDIVINDVYSGPISCLLFDSLGKYILTGGEKHVRVFHNVTGYRTTITSIQAKFHQSLSSAQKERMEQQIKEAEIFLKSIGESS